MSDSNDLPDDPEQLEKHIDAIQENAAEDDAAIPDDPEKIEQLIDDIKAEVDSRKELSEKKKQFLEDLEHHQKRVEDASQRINDVHDDLLG